MATNKELVEQAVAAIPLWQAFLNQKEAEQDLILQQMQDDDVQFAPKSLTQRLTDRFKSTKEPEQPPQINTQADDLDISKGVKLEKELLVEKPLVEEPLVEEVSETLIEQEYETGSDDRPPANDKDFKDLF